MTHVVHVLGGLGRGGAETWVLELVRRASCDVKHSVVTTSGGSQDLLADFIEAGARVVTVPRANTIPGLLAFLRDVRGNSYDAVHCHMQHASWMYLGVAALARVRRRVFTAHLDSRAEHAASGPLRRAYMRIASRCVSRFATDIHGVSDAAGSSMWGPRWQRDANSSVVHCGVDVTRFQPRPPSQIVRDELALSGDEVVFLHVGRFVVQKNHAFLLSWFASIRNAVPGSVLLMVGTGPLEVEAKTQSVLLGIDPYVKFLGSRSDVADLMNVASVVLLPSVREGLPLVALEAQASGTPIVMSDAVTSEAVVVGDLAKRIGLESPMHEWVEETIELVRKVTPILRSEGALAVSASDFNIAASVAKLERTYRS